jgi:hypothetical protein
VAGEVAGAMTYDSSADTLAHIRRVHELLSHAAEQLIGRAVAHDQSKLLPEEKDVFDEYTPLLKTLTYGSQEYKDALEEMEPALRHHYSSNSHHPEHYPDGLDGFDLFDLVEMFFDWKAASERHANGDIRRSIDVNQKRFAMSEQLAKILRNTADRCWP